MSGSPAKTPVKRRAVREQEARSRGRRGRPGCVTSLLYSGARHKCRIGSPRYQVPGAHEFTAVNGRAIDPYRRVHRVVGVIARTTCTLPMSTACQSQGVRGPSFKMLAPRPRSRRIRHQFHITSSCKLTRESGVSTINALRVRRQRCGASVVKRRTVASTAMGRAEGRIFPPICERAAPPSIAPRSFVEVMDRTQIGWCTALQP